MNDPSKPSEFLWGARAIAEAIGLDNEQQVWELQRAGLLGDAVKRISHKRILGLRSRLVRRLSDAPNWTKPAARADG